MISLQPPRRGPAGPLFLVGWLTLASAGCGGGGGGGGGGVTVPVGEEQAKPGGGTFFVDPHKGGQSSRFGMEELFWGRLVNVHDVDGAGTPSLEPVFRDLVVNENAISDGSNYTLITNPVTQETRLVIKRTKGAPDTGSGTFDSLLRAVAENLPPVIPKNDDGTSPEPFSVIPRNATLVIRFDDLLDDSVEAASLLGESVLVKTGYPPTLPFATRIVFDPNHGGIKGSHFHTTRILIDMTVTEAEAQALLYSAAINTLGLPPSRTGEGQPNVSVRIPTRVDFGSGQFELLTNLSGGPMRTSDNGPVDTGAPTRDVVRAMRSGRKQDMNNGFLLDPIRPELVGSWLVDITAAVEDPASTNPGTLFLVDFTFQTPCQRRPRQGDILLIGQEFIEVATTASPPDGGGTVRNVSVRPVSGGSILDPVNLLGSGSFLSTYTPGLPVGPGCWVTFLPQGGQPPSADIVSDARVLVRFSEPMDPVSVRPFDSFRLVRGVLGTPIQPNNTVVGDVSDSLDLREFTFVPSLPFATQNGLSYTVDLVSGAEGVTDLAGNPLVAGLPRFEFQLDASNPLEINGGIVFRFTSDDELQPLGFPDLRGQATYDFLREIIQPRPVSYSSVPADRSNSIVAVMTPFGPGLQTPLSPFGSKMQTVWRYADLGWQVRDETKFNVDVTGMAWSPASGQVVSDFYDQFEIRLSHSRKLPDERFIQAGIGPKYPDSGIGKDGGAPCISTPPAVPFNDNILLDPRSPQKTVHPRFLGYRVDPTDLFLSATGTFLMPYPINKGGGELVTYTWRDTAILAKDGIAGAGIPMDIEVGPPLFLDTGVGSVAGAGKVPSIGLPLLWEVRCYPSDSGLGLNAHDVSLGINTFCNPNFRTFSTGGLDINGSPVFKDPDLEELPDGGLNPVSTPPGLPTRLNSDNTYYIGQLDIVIRVSRAHTIWVDTGLAASAFQPPILEPNAAEQPFGTEVAVEFRGANAFDASVGIAPFDAAALDFYGDLPEGTTTYLNGDSSWKSDLRDLNGSRYVQARISFINNIQSGDVGILDSIGLAWKSL